MFHRNGEVQNIGPGSTGSKGGSILVHFKFPPANQENIKWGHWQGYDEMMASTIAVDGFKFFYSERESSKANYVAFKAFIEKHRYTEKGKTTKKSFIWFDIDLGW